jgi:hypothetical protein
MSDTVPEIQENIEPTRRGAQPMLFLFGVRRKEKPIGQVERPCSKCARATVHMALEYRSWFTLFFIPVIPFGTSYLTRCNLCGMKYKTSEELKSKISALAMAAKA